VCLLHVRAARFPDAALCLRSGRAPMETPNFVRVVHIRKPQILFGSGRVVSCVGARANAFGRVGSARTRPVGPCRAVCGARAHVGVPKMLSRDRSCVLCMFVWPVCLMLPRGFVRVVRPRKPRNFVRVVRPWKPQISFGRVGTCRVWVPVQTGRVVSCDGTQGTRGRIKSAKL
jgi:hypothetical protein